MELVKAYPINESDDIFAVWRDDIGSFTAIHDAQGQPTTLPGPGVYPPWLTAEQVAQAIAPARHPAYDLADKGTAANPAHADRMQKAAAIVEAGGVTLTSDDTARVVSESGNIYAVGQTTCTCPDHKYAAPGGWCKHRLAVRMARALGQTPGYPGGNEPDGDDAKERHSAERPLTAREDSLHRQAAGHRRIAANERGFRDWCNTDSDAGRAYVLAAAGAGRTAAASDSKLRTRQQQARKYQDSPEMAALKARVKAELGLGG